MVLPLHCCENVNVVNVYHIEHASNGNNNKLIDPSYDVVDDDALL